MNKPLSVTRRWERVACFCLIFTSAMGGGMWAITWPAIVAWHRHQPVPGGWNFASIIVANLLMLGLFGFMCGSAICDVWITFTETSIAQRTLAGRVKTITWHEVQRIEYTEPVITIRSATQAIAINTSFFDRKELALLIQSHVPAHTLPGRLVTERDFD